jgi:hypothetical protein
MKIKIPESCEACQFCAFDDAGDNCCCLYNKALRDDLEEIPAFCTAIQVSVIDLSDFNMGQKTEEIRF